MNFGWHDDLKDVSLDEIWIFFCAAREVSHVVKMDAGDVESSRGKHFDVVTKTKIMSGVVNKQRLGINFSLFQHIATGLAIYWF